MPEWGLSKRAVGGVFWAWLCFRWVNDWLGGLVVPPEQPLLSPEWFSFFQPLLPPEWYSFIQPLAFAVQYLPALAAAAWVTVLLTVSAIVLGFPIAVVLAAARVYGRVTSWLALGYIELIRGTPLLAQLFVLYYGLRLTQFIRSIPGVGEGIIPAQAFWVAIIGLTINSAAYQAEYFRGAIQSVDRGQLQAARALGLSQTRGIQHVVLPQALRYAIPSWTNELVYLIKYSSLAAFITVPELFQRADSIASRTFEYLPLFILAGLIYLVFVLTATNLMDEIERRVAIPGLGGEGRR